MSIRFQALRGMATEQRMEPVAALRIRVFRDWPYLYEGSLEFERKYLATFALCNASFVVLAWDGEQCVGATTALPLANTQAEVRAPFEQAGMDIHQVLYFGESVVLSSHRGQGIGLHFFAAREAHAQALGLRQCAFCAVDRPVDHPLRPAHYVPNDAFWQRRGYTRLPELVSTFSRQDVDQAAATPHALTYWLKTL